MSKIIFISYSQEDFKPEARYLCNYLSKHIPDSEVFIDQLKAKGMKWQEENDEKLLQSSLFVVIITNGALTSKEVEREIQLAKTDENRKIIPCKDDLLKMDWEQLPWNLEKFDGLEFERKEELGRKLVGEIRVMFSSIESIKEQSSNTKPIQILGLPHTKIDLNYRITNGEVLSSMIDRDSSSLIVGVTTFGDGFIELSLPRRVIDAKKGGQLDQFFVILDNEEVKFDEEIDETVRILKIQLPYRTEKVEIIGTEILGTSYYGQTIPENRITILKDSSMPHGGKYLDKEVLTVKVGEKVRWINNDTAAHTITSGTPEDGPNGNFDSSIFMSNNSYDVTFGQRGVFDYFCMVHPWKKGKIIVK